MEAKGRIAALSGVGRVPPKTRDGFVLMRMRARAWAAVLRVWDSVGGRAVHAAMRSLTAPCWASCPRIFAVMDREDIIVMMRARGLEYPPTSFRYVLVVVQWIWCNFSCGICVGLELAHPFLLRCLVGLIASEI
jgi:hypothetical protein